MQKNKFGVYEYKRSIPKDLLDKLSQYKSGFIKSSLKTKDYEEAKKLNKAKDAKVEKLFSRLRGEILETSGKPAIPHTPKYNVPSAPKVGKGFSDLISLWERESRPTLKTVGAMKQAVLLFENILGQQDIGHITKADIPCKNLGALNLYLAGRCDAHFYCDKTYFYSTFI